MSPSEQKNSPLFDLRASVAIAATPEEIHAVVSDLGRSGEWSPECLGGEWVSGEPGAVGSVFRGRNLRSPEVVSWAPVVRGHWTTESEVVAAERGRTFHWAMRDSAGNRQRSVWGFDIRPAHDAGPGREEAATENTGPRARDTAKPSSVLVHSFRMDSATEGIRGIVSGMGPGERQKFFTDWSAKLEADLAITLERIKKIIEA